MAQSAGRRCTMTQIGPNDGMGGGQMEDEPAVMEHHLREDTVTSVRKGEEKGGETLENRKLC